MSKPKDITCNKKDCFAYNRGVCSVLSNTRFKKGCPFYKKKRLQ